TPMFDQYIFSEGNQLAFTDWLKSVSENIIVDMASRAHEDVVMRLSHFFHQANRNQRLHYHPAFRKMIKIAPDLCIGPNKVYVQAPTFATRPVTRHQSYTLSASTSRSANSSRRH
ncbi:9169_t:CDS:2, partial [Paraglomus brasilianum]